MLGTGWRTWRSVGIVVSRLQYITWMWNYEISSCEDFGGCDMKAPQATSGVWKMLIVRLYTGSTPGTHFKSEVCRFGVPLWDGRAELRTVFRGMNTLNKMLQIQTYHQKDILRHLMPQLMFSPGPGLPPPTNARQQYVTSLFLVVRAYSWWFTIMRSRKTMPPTLAF